MNQSSISSEAPWKRKLAFASAQAQAADFAGVQNICAQMALDHGDDPLALLDIGALLLNVGFIISGRH